VIKDDRLVYTREFQDSYYRPSTFVLAKLIAEIPATVVAAFAYGFLLYWTVGLTAGWETFLFFCLVFFCQMVRAGLCTRHPLASVTITSAQLEWAPVSVRCCR
jgi:hypothetical protein